jgi:hypothetical protein
MPNDTDESTRTEPELTTVRTSPLATSSTASVARQRADDESLTHESFDAVLSSNQRGGRWEPADEIRARAILGEVTLDFTRAVLPASGIIEIEAWAIFGEVKIVVPDGADVEIDGTPILGSIEHQVRRKEAREKIREWVTGERDEDTRPASLASDEPPYFRIDGRAIFGSIKVTGR